MTAAIPATSPPMEEWERLRVAGRRARSLVYLLLARRDDLRVRVGGDGDDVPLDFAVSIGPASQAARRFDISLHPTLDDKTFDRPENHAATIDSGLVWPDLPFPVVKFLVHAVRDEMKYRWLLRPHVAECGFTLTVRNATWERLDPAALEAIVAEVAGWYDAARNDRLAA